MAADNLLHEFPPVTTASWEAVIAKDLKGADYAKKLIWQTEEGLAVKPYYRAEDLAGLEYLDVAPGVFPYIRGDRPTGNWRIREEIEVEDPKGANLAARAAVAAGAEEIAFLNAHDALKTASDFAALVSDLQEIPIHFQNADESLLRLLVATKISSSSSTSLSAGFDPFQNFDFASEILAKVPSTFVPFTIPGNAFEEAGATVVQDVGFTLAAGIDFLAEMQARNAHARANITRAAAAITFSFAIGSNYFFEIAKLRAFRLLWARVVESFGGSTESAKARIHARTSRWNETVYDPHLNVLRGTTEAMSAALGGADSISVAPFDECYKAPDEASRRLARNTQIILKQEALLSRVADPGGGAYCLEVITDFIAREAWKVMQGIEASGGYAKAKSDGRIQTALQLSMAAKEKAVISRRRIFTGTNQHANLTEKALDRIEPSHTTAVHRGAEIYEQLRLRTERHAAKGGKLPSVLLAEIGDVKMRSARSNFAANFFGCAGFMIATHRFDSVAEIASAASATDLVVLCSSDTEYPALVPEFIAKLKATHSKASVIIAGYPDSAEQLKAAGVADFVHVRSNPIEVLTKWQDHLGIEK